VQLTFIRHAQPDGTTAGDDPPLSELGRRQVEHLAQAAVRWRRPLALWVSPCLRARQTGAALAAVWDLPAHTAEWLAEIRPEAEAFAAFRDRIARGLSQTLAAHGAAPMEGSAGRWRLGSGEATLVLVGHGAANAVAVEHLLGVEPVAWAPVRFPFVHTAVTTLRAFALQSGEHVFSLHRHGNLSHLPAALRSY
jgi:broad specificity phosphatase PhoE